MDASLVVSPAQIADWLRDGSLALGLDGAPSRPVLLVDLDAPAADGVEVGEPLPAILVGVARGPLTEPAAALAAQLTCTLVSGSAAGRTTVAADDLDTVASELVAAILRHPRASLTLDGVLRTVDRAGVADGLHVESLAYSMLLAGAEFSAWRSSRPVRPAPAPVSEDVLVDRHDDVLEVILNRPERRNAFSRGIRDRLVDALDLARWDPTIRRVLISGAGPAFCSGGDLDEFGTTPDVAVAHLIRSDRSVARRIDAVRDVVEVTLHGSCVGAGIELPSFAAQVVARADTSIALPEVGMGLIPGAGGTVGITKRVGRWRAAFMALSGRPINATTALEWGLVDELVDE